ncbi:MAG: hypothetical protein AAGC93_02030 [Cyanobacteria bacterium P01_F01_bin.53]
MDQQTIDVIAQFILSLSDEERQALEMTVNTAAHSHHGAVVLTEADKTQRIAEIAQDIQTFEERYYPLLGQRSTQHPLVAENDSFFSEISPEDDLDAAVRLVQSLQSEEAVDGAKPEA